MWLVKHAVSIVQHTRGMSQAVLHLQYVPLGAPIKVMKKAKAESAPFKPPRAGSAGPLGKPYEYIPCPVQKRVRHSHHCDSLLAVAPQSPTLSLETDDPDDRDLQYPNFFHMLVG